MEKQKGSDLFIVDNSDTDWKVLNYLHDWCQLSSKMDIATGYFEIGSLLALKDEWQKIDQIRLLMGDEVSQRTKKAFEQGLASTKKRLDDSLEKEKEKNDFLSGVPAIVEGIQSEKILTRVYRKDKFHAKAYITHARQEVIGSFALIGSSNFTYPGLVDNIELNVQISGRQVNTLQQWYEGHWDDAEDVTAEVLKTIERHTREYAPFEVYAKALQEFFRGHEMTSSEWENDKSVIYPILAQYQKEGYHSLLKRSKRYNGAFLCDGVGLGKTFIGLMLIERLVMHDRKNVVLFVPKAARKPVWELHLKKYLSHIFGAYSRLEIYNHTDLMRGGDYPEKLKTVRERADVVIIDEAHHFRNTGTKGEKEDERRSRYWQMHDICEGKTVYMLTATPVNNSLHDLRHMTELFSRGKSDYFKEAPLGIHSLTGHFQKMEKDLRKAVSGEQDDGDSTNLFEAANVLDQDAFFHALVVQRSRKYVKASLKQSGSHEAKFPKPRDPKVAEYSVKQTYGKLLSMVERAFHKDKPLFALPIYYPYAHYIGDDENIDPFIAGRQKQVVSLIRTGFLKRFESSAEAFRQSCWNLMLKLLAWVEVHAETPSEKRILERWKNQHDELIGYMPQVQVELFGGGAEEDADDDIVPEELLQAVEKLDREEFEVGDIIDETMLDLNQITEFLKELQQFKAKQDKKLTALIKLLKKDSVLNKNKVIIFTEFMTTARYLKRELESADIEGVAEIDSAVKGDRGEVIRRFAPYYNGSSSGELKDEGLEEIRVLISTDVLSEGLNLQDATRLINYDIHWNPVRLMQRIGRVDRRMNPEIEAKILADHPDQKKLRGTTMYWNFLPPDELNQLLSLYKTVTHKTLRISKTFGIEGKKLLTPEDEYDELKNFHESYEGALSPVEGMHLEYQQLLKDDAGLEGRLNNLPGRVFSGKEHINPGTRAVFFCYARPARELEAIEEGSEEIWSTDAGDVQWYLYELETEEIIEDAVEIIDLIRSKPSTKRSCIVEQKTLSDIRVRIDKHIKNTYLKKVQAPVGVKPVLKTWMELN